MRFRFTRQEIARRLRRNATSTERYVWRLLRNRRMLGLRFRRQHPVGPFIVDFYCAELRLVLELDGHTHATSPVAAYDASRTEWLVRHEYHVRRIGNHEVSRENLRHVIAGVTSLTEPARSPPSPPVQGGEGDRG